MRVLLVEDDTSTAKSIELMLKSEGYIIDSTDLGEDGLDLGKIYDYDIIILDLMLPDMDGYDVLKALRDSKVETPVLILSGLAELDSKIKALGFGADDYLTKPFDKRELVARIQEARVELDQERLEQEIVYMANKTDVEEELDRLNMHVAEVRRVLAEDKPIGRRLDFLMQELNREANTLGSKSVHTETTRASVDLKVFIEQMREQIQNIE